MQFLQRPNLDVASALVCSNGLNDCLRARHRGDAGDVILQSSATNCLLVEVGGAAQRCVDDQRDLAPLDVVDDIRTPFVYLKDALDFQANLSQTICSPQ